MKSTQGERKEMLFFTDICKSKLKGVIALTLSYVETNKIVSDCVTCLYNLILLKRGREEEKDNCTLVAWWWFDCQVNWIERRLLKITLTGEWVDGFAFVSFSCWWTWEEMLFLAAPAASRMRNTREKREEGEKMRTTSCLPCPMGLIIIWVKRETS